MARCWLVRVINKLIEEAKRPEAAALPLMEDPTTLQNELVECVLRLLQIVHA